MTQHDPKVIGEGPCVDWQWAEGKRGPTCRRHMICGAFVPDACPLAVRASLQDNPHD